MMIKVFESNSYDFGDQVATLVKRSSRGLLGEDFRVLVKRAGEEFATAIRDIKLAPGEEPVHLLAMGTTEAYGPNRNGDGFKQAAQAKYHPTFVKYARHYRHHRNKDPKISFGVVKASAFNPRMQRTELLVALNATKEAAERNGGLVADKEMDKLASGSDIPVSMACKVAYDVCSGCGNKARTRDEYCTEENCDYGGCKDNLTKVSEDGHVLHVDNPHPTFFDISTVFRPADRIAYGNVADYMSKAASGSVISGSEWAELYGVTPPLSLLMDGVTDAAVAEQIKLAYHLATLEDEIEDHGAHWQRKTALAFSPSIQPPIDFSAVGGYKLASVMNALAGQSVMLPARDFISLATGGDSEKTAALSATVSGLLPGIYNRLVLSDDLATLIKTNTAAPSRDLAPATLRRWAEKLASDYGTQEGVAHQRVIRASIRDVLEPTRLQRTAEKRSAALGPAAELAERYALYKLAFIARQKQEDIPLTCTLAIVQNYVNC